MKGTIPFLPIIISALVVLIVFHIVTSKENPVQKIMKTLEGFQVPVVSSPRCPGGFKFFNDRQGESFCCAGGVNVFSHTCMSKGANDLCAFVPKSKDPRNPERTLPLCASLITQQHQTNQDTLCPAALPHFASIGKCCMYGTDMDGYNCADFDNQDKSRYCILNGTPKPGEQRCDALQRQEQATCPAALQKVNYTLGQKESQKYGEKVKGLQIPVCFNPTSSCIPENILAYAQGHGAWTDKNPATWSYACANWTKVNINRDTTGNYDTNYA